jgi:hypothetical protein
MKTNGRYSYLLTILNGSYLLKVQPYLRGGTSPSRTFTSHRDRGARVGRRACGARPRLCTGAVQIDGTSGGGTKEEVPGIVGLVLRFKPPLLDHCFETELVVSRGRGHGHRLGRLLRLLTARGAHTRCTPRRIEATRSSTRRRIGLRERREQEQENLTCNTGAPDPRTGWLTAEAEERAWRRSSSRVRVSEGRGREERGWSKRGEEQRAGGEDTGVHRSVDTVGRRRGHRSGGAESPVAGHELERRGDGEAEIENGMLGLRTRHAYSLRNALLRLNGSAPCRGLRGPGSCLHHGPTWQPKHGTGTPAVMPGRASPVLGRAGCRAAPQAGPFWTCIVRGDAGEMLLFVPRVKRQPTQPHRPPV